MTFGQTLWLLFTVFWGGVLIYCDEGNAINLFIFAPLMGLATAGVITQGLAGIWLAWNGQELLEDLWKGLTGKK
jgi:hypothetical protein